MIDLNNIQVTEEDFANILYQKDLAIARLSKQLKIAIDEINRLSPEKEEKDDRIPEQSETAT